MEVAGPPGAPPSRCLIEFRRPWGGARTSVSPRRFDPTGALDHQGAVRLSGCEAVRVQREPAVAAHRHGRSCPGVPHRLPGANPTASAGRRLQHAQRAAREADPASRGLGPSDFSDVYPNFDGTFDLCCPADPNGDVGPNHYVQMVNSSFEIFDKQGTSLAGPSRISTIWTGAGDTGDCSTDDDGDPIVLYDPLADRWMLSQFAFTATERAAVSRVHRGLADARSRRGRTSCTTSSFPRRVQRLPAPGRVARRLLHELPAGVLRREPGRVGVRPRQHAQRHLRQPGAVHDRQSGADPAACRPRRPGAPGRRARAVRPCDRREPLGRRRPSGGLRLPRGLGQPGSLDVHLERVPPDHIRPGHVQRDQPVQQLRSPAGYRGPPGVADALGAAAAAVPQLRDPGRSGVQPQRRRERERPCRRALVRAPTRLSSIIRSATVSR